MRLAWGWTEPSATPEKALRPSSASQRPRWGWRASTEGRAEQGSPEASRSPSPKGGTAARPASPCGRPPPNPQQRATRRRAQPPCQDGNLRPAQEAPFFTTDPHGGHSALLTRVTAPTSFRPMAEGPAFERHHPSTRRVKAASSSPPVAASGGASSEHLLYARHRCGSGAGVAVSSLLLGEGGRRGQAIPRPRRRKHGHAFPPSTLHRWPPKSRTLCFSEALDGPLKSQEEAVKGLSPPVARL